MQLGTGEGEYWSDGCICISAWRGVAWHATDIIEDVAGTAIAYAYGLRSVCTPCLAARCGRPPGPAYSTSMHAMRCDATDRWATDHRTIGPSPLCSSLPLSLSVGPLHCPLHMISFSFFFFSLEIVCSSTPEIVCSSTRVVAAADM